MGCRGYSSFALPGSRKKFCSSHRREGMIPSGRSRAASISSSTGSTSTTPAAEQNKRSTEQPRIQQPPSPDPKAGTETDVSATQTAERAAGAAKTTLATATEVASVAPACWSGLLTSSPPSTSSDERLIAAAAAIIAPSAGRRGGEQSECKTTEATHQIPKYTAQLQTYTLSPENSPRKRQGESCPTVQRSSADGGGIGGGGGERDPHGNARYNGRGKRGELAARVLERRTSSNCKSPYSHLYPARNEDASETKGSSDVSSDCSRKQLGVHHETTKTEKCRSRACGEFVERFGENSSGKVGPYIGKVQEVTAENHAAKRQRREGNNREQQQVGGDNGAIDVMHTAPKIWGRGGTYLERSVEHPETLPGQQQQVRGGLAFGGISVMAAEGRGGFARRPLVVHPETPPGLQQSIEFGEDDLMIARNSSSSSSSFHGKGQQTTRLLPPSSRMLSQRPLTPLSSEVVRRTTSSPSTNSESPNSAAEKSVLGGGGRWPQAPVASSSSTGDSPASYHHYYRRGSDVAASRCGDMGSNGCGKTASKARSMVSHHATSTHNEDSVSSGKRIVMGSARDNDKKRATRESCLSSIASVSGCSSASISGGKSGGYTDDTHGGGYPAPPVPPRFHYNGHNIVKSNSGSSRGGRCPTPGSGGGSVAPQAGCLTSVAAAATTSTVDLREADGCSSSPLSTTSFKPSTSSSSVNDTNRISSTNARSNNIISPFPINKANNCWGPDTEDGYNNSNSSKAMMARNDFSSSSSSYKKNTSSSTPRWAETALLNRKLPGMTTTDKSLNMQPEGSATTTLASLNPPWGGGALPNSKTGRSKISSSGGGCLGNEGVRLAASTTLSPPSSTWPAYARTPSSRAITQQQKKSGVNNFPWRKNGIDHPSASRKNGSISWGSAQARDSDDAVCAYGGRRQAGVMTSTAEGSSSSSSVVMLHGPKNNRFLKFDQGAGSLLPTLETLEPKGL